MPFQAGTLRWNRLSITSLILATPRKERHHFVRLGRAIQDVLEAQQMRYTTLSHSAVRQNDRVLSAKSGLNTIQTTEAITDQSQAMYFYG
jgi:hypothetical protein